MKTNSWRAKAAKKYKARRRDMDSDEAVSIFC